MNANEADQILQRVAVLALLHDPAATAPDPTYSLAGDIRWALSSCPSLSQPDRDRLTDVIARVIFDPTGSRRDLVTALHLPAE